MYVDGIRTQVPVIMGENGFVLENPVLNPSPFATQWTGAAKGINSNDWFDSGNWDNGVPGAITDVTIPGGLTNYPTILSHYPPASCASITIGDGGSFIGAEYLTTGIATVKRTISDTRAHFLSSPVSSNTFGNVFANSISVWARWWNPLAESWEYRTSSNMFAIGTGYNVSTTTPGVTANYTGELNCTDVTLSLSNANGGWNLLGNPYPSAIDWDEVFKDDGISGSVAAWNGTNYIYWNGTTGSLTDGIIQAVNGFFVSTTINGSTLTIPLSARVHNPAPILKETVPYVLKLRVNGNTASDETFIHFNDNATAAYDNLYDARKLWGEDFAPQLYSMIEGDVLAINELPFDGNKTIDLGFRCNTNGEYILNASGIESFEDSTLILLEDLKNNKLQDLRNEPVYNFKYQAGDNAGRFKLHFRTQSADNDPDNSGISVYSYDHNIILTNTTGIEGKVTVYDMTGREIISTNISNQVTTSIPMPQAVTGYYVLKIFTAKTNVIQKVFIQ